MKKARKVKDLIQVRAEDIGYLSHNQEPIMLTKRAVFKRKGKEFIFLYSCFVEVRKREKKDGNKCLYETFKGCCIEESWKLRI